MGHGVYPSGLAQDGKGCAGGRSGAEFAEGDADDDNDRCAWM